MTENLKIEPTIITKDPYFQENITFYSDNERISCKVCHDGFKPLYPNKDVPEEKFTCKKRWLINHLMTNKTHLSFEPDLPGLRRALKLFGKELPFQSRELLPIQRIEKELKEEENSDARSSLQVDHGQNSSNGVTNISKQSDVDLLFDVSKFLITKHMPFDAASDILQFAQKINSSYDPEVITRAHSSSTGISQIIKNCIGKTFSP